MGIVAWLFPSCNVLRFVPEGKSLVEANRVKVEGTHKVEGLKDQILLRPNRKMLMLVKFNLWAYYIGNKVFRRDSTRIKKFFVETVGEKPVYLDQNLVRRSERNMEQYLYQKGHFNATVSSRVKTVLKRSYITYYANPGSPYYLRNIYYNGSEMVFDKAAAEFAKGSRLKTNEEVDFTKIEEERDRLTSEFRNHGFYYFNKAFIKMVLDTGGHNRGADLNINIFNPGEAKNAQTQLIEKVVVEMNFRQRFGRRDTLKYEGINYLFNGYSIKPNIINRSIKLRKGELFAQNNLEATYNRLIGLGLFKAVSIKLYPSKNDSSGRLVVYINLLPSAKYDFIWEPQVITTDKPNLNSQDNNPRNYGFANQFILNNKNVFGNAEDFNIKFRVAAETQFGGGVDVEVLGIRSNIFGNFESNLTFELLFPKLVGIRKVDLDKRLQKNHTSLNLTYLTEINTNYSRRSIPVNLTYQTLYQTHDKQQYFFYWSPVQFSYNEASLRESFISSITNPADSLRLVRAFRNYIIPAQKFTMVYTNREKSPNSFWNIRYTPLELSGNLMELAFRLNGQTGKEKKLFGNPYFQFVRTELDVVKYKIYGKDKTLVLRGNVGIGRPYGNSYILPFERQFFVGGSNSLRAWRPRILGPGESPNTNGSQIDKTGDMMIVTNAEYRFAIVSGLLDGAFFLDAGNIWQITNTATPSTKFEPNTFYKQMALNTGIGLRLNLSFFIVRVDWGIPLHDPSELRGDRWVIRDVFDRHWVTSRTVPLLAIGYPF